MGKAQLRRVNKNSYKWKYSQAQWSYVLQWTADNQAPYTLPNLGTTIMEKSKERLYFSLYYKDNNAVNSILQKARPSSF